MTRREYIQTITDALKPRYGPREASSIAWLMAETRALFDRRDIASDPFMLVSDNGIQDALAELAAGRPVQYVLGQAWFRGLRYQVDHNVLIPRPETEELVGWIISEQADGGKILDIGTGSGAIAISLAREITGVQVTAADISHAALDVARRNAATHNEQINFIRADALAGDIAGCYDVIVSNPPYVPQSEREAMASHVVDYEPHLALFVPDNDPLLFYRAIARYAMRSGLVAGGRLYFELHDNFARQTAEMLAAEGFEQIEVREDINGKPRMCRCKKP